MRGSICLLAGGLCLAATIHPLAVVEAAKEQRKQVLRGLLAQHADVNVRDGDGSTALHWAAHWDDLETVRSLIQAGANVDAATDLGITPLYLACTNGSGGVAKALLDAHANPNLAATTGITPLMMAARSGSVDAAQALLSHGATVDAKENTDGQTALMWAVARRHPEIGRLLLEYGADVNARSNSRSVLFNTSGPGSNLLAGGGGEGSKGAAKMIPVGGSTPILFAARVGCIDCARMLLDHGARVNDASPDGNTALVLAAHSGEGRFAAFLLDRGANPNASGGGYTALHAAVLRGDLDLVKALLQHGADPNAKLQNGTPIRRGGPDFAFPAYLIGATPLLLAAKYADAEMIRVLAAAGADTKLSATDGTTPLIAAAGADHRTGGPAGIPPADEAQALAAVRAVLECGGELNALNRVGNSAVHIAALRGYDSVLQLLFEKGARLDVKNGRGQTPRTIVPPQFKSTLELLNKLENSSRDYFQR
jgi:ankyrin repeat protein